MTDQELRDLVASLAVESKKTDEMLRKSSEEFDKRIKKFEQERKQSSEDFDRQLKKSREEFDKRMREFEQERKQSSEEFDKRFEKSSAEFDKRIKKLEQTVGGIGNNQGDVAEEYFINSLKNKLTIGDMKFDYIFPNYEVEGKKIKDEFDIVLTNDDTVAIVEVKYKVHPNDLEKLPKKIENFKKLSQYPKHKIYAGIAGFKIPKNVIDQALSLGYFVLQRKGDVIVSYFDDELRAA